MPSFSRREFITRSESPAIRRLVHESGSCFVQIIGDQNLAIRRMTREEIRVADSFAER
jgi:hypothetical protein